MNRALLFVVALAFITVPTHALASPEDQVSQALAVSENWVKQIDQGQYDESYAVACDAMKDKVPNDRWDLILQTMRGHWGAVVSRKEVSHVYKPDGLQGASGEFMIITYETNFAQLYPAFETIVLKWEDGQWRGAGYNAGAKPTDDDSATEGADSTTEINTQEHVRPQVNTPATTP